MTGFLLGAAALVLFSAGSVAAEATDPPNATPGCSASATVEGGETIDPYVSSGVYEIPLEGSARYTGQVGDGSPRAERDFNGQVVIETPPGFPDIELADEWTWRGRGTGAMKEGDVKWNLPEIMPRGVPFKVSGFHQDQGLRCEGFVRVGASGVGFVRVCAPAAKGSRLSARASRRVWIGREVMGGPRGRRFGGQGARSRHPVRQNTLAARRPSGVRALGWTQAGMASSPSPKPVAKSSSET